MLKTISAALPPASGRAVLLKHNQNTDDIIRALVANHRENVAQGRRIAHHFEADTVRDVCRKIWDFLRNHIPYEIEPASRQTVKTISRMIHDASRGKGSDCKHYATFTGVVLQALKIPFVYRFAGYTSPEYPGHVYAVATPAPGVEIIIDAVLPQFDTEKTPLFVKDMALMKLSGIPGSPASELVTGDGVGFDKLCKGFEKACLMHPDGIGAVKAGKKNIIQKIAQGTKTVGLAVPRNAFLVLTAENVFGLASKIREIERKRGRDGLEFWKKIGGDRDALLKAVQSGEKKKPLTLKEVQATAQKAAQVLNNKPAGNKPADKKTGILARTVKGRKVGEVLTISAAIASAAPIIAEVKKALEAAGIDTREILEAGKQAAAAFEQTTGKKLSEVVFKKDTGKDGGKTTLSPADLKPTTEGDAAKVADAAAKEGAGIAPPAPNVIPPPSPKTGGGFNKYIVPLGLGLGLLLVLK